MAGVAGAAALLALARAGGPPAARVRGPALALLAGVAAYLLLWGLPWNASGWQAHHRFLFEQARYPRDFPATLIGFVGLGGRAARLLPVTLGWPILIGAALAVVLRASFAGLGARAAAVALYALGFLAAIGYVYPRFLLPVLLLLLPLATRGWSRALDRAGARAPLLVAALVGLAAIGGPLLGVAQLRDTRVLAAEWLRAHAGPGATLECVGNPRFQPRFPPGLTLTRWAIDSLLVAPRSPRAEFVVLSGFDRYAIEGDSALRGAWMGPLAGPHAEYTLVADIPPPRWSRIHNGLPFSPVIWIWQRR
jgi:hypothetical protein